MESKFCLRYCLPSARSMERSPSSAAETCASLRGEVRACLVEPHTERVPAQGVEVGVRALEHRADLLAPVELPEQLRRALRLGVVPCVEVKIDFTRLDSEPPPSAPTYIRQSRHRGAPESATTAGEALSCGARSLVL